MSRKGIGGMLLFLGIGGFILPLFGLQFRILNILGKGQYVIAGILAVIGLILRVVKE